MMSYQEMLRRKDFPLILAPMEEVTDHSFRVICKRFGADILISEFVSSEAIIRDVPKSLKKMAFDDAERPFGIQIFGYDENSLRKAAEIAAAENPDFIDINWGCPVKKVVAKGAGSAILKNIPKMRMLTKAVVDTVSIPVSVKTRLGWDDYDKPIVLIAEQLQDVGIQAITIHGRTRSQLYKGKADWTLIGKVKNNQRMYIPVIGNGDIDSAEKAVEYKNRYGVDAIMIGRAAVGNPWIFQRIKNYVRNLSDFLPSFEERVLVCLEHLHFSSEWKGEKLAVMEMRRHYAHYFKGIQNFKTVKLELMQAKTLSECDNILKNFMLKMRA